MFSNYFDIASTPSEVFTKPVIGNLKNMCILKRPFGLQRCNPGGFTMLYAAFHMRQLLQLPQSILEITEHIMKKRVIRTT